MNEKKRQSLSLLLNAFSENGQSSSDIGAK
jgi:hypothetical protein